MKTVPKRLLVVGGLFGVGAAFSPGSLFVLLLVAATVAALRRFIPSGDRVFLIRLFLAAFFVRAILSLGLDLGSRFVEGTFPVKNGPVEYWNLGILDRTRGYLRMGDSDYYSERGYSLAQYASGVREPAILRRIQDYGHNGYVLIIGWFYYLFGFSPISVKLLNGWIGALHVLPIFFLAKSCFQPTIARWTAVGVAGFPTLVFWSTANLKEPLMFLLTAVLFLLFRFFQIAHTLSRRALLGGLFLLTFYLLSDLSRREFFLVLVACLMLAFSVEQCFRKRWFAALILGAVALIYFGFPVIREGLHLAVYRHRGYVGEPGITYRYLPEKFYLPGFSMPTEAIVRAIPNAVMHYLLEPNLLWAGSRFALFLVPQMIPWYFLLPLALIGVAAGLRRKPWNCGFLAMILFFWILMGALSNANIGTLIRLRDMVTPIVLLFAAAGFWTFARGSTGLSQEASTL